METQAMNIWAQDQIVMRRTNAMKIASMLPAGTEAALKTLDEARDLVLWARREAEVVRSEREPRSAA